MRQALFVITGLLLFFGVSPGQGGNKPEAVQVRRYERAGSGFDAITEANYELTRIAGRPDDVAVVRVCSREPMPLALSSAAMNPFTVARALNQGYNFALERILFLRSEDCLGSDSAVAATELWAVPRGAALPTFVESIKSSQARLEIVGTKTLLAAGTKNYRLAIKELTTKMRAAPEATGVVVGYYFKQPSPEMKRRVSDAQNLLEQSGLPRARYSVRLMPWPGERSIDPPEPEPKYPSVFLVELLKARVALEDKLHCLDCAY
jgi:hypothetical protein